MSGFAAALASGYGQTALNILVQLGMVPLYLAYLGTDGFGLLTLYLAGVSWLALGYGWASNGGARLLGECFARGEHDRFALVYAVSLRVAVAYAGAIGAVALAITAIAAPAQLAPMLAFAIYMLLAYIFGVDRMALTARGRQAEGNVIAMLAQVAFAAMAIGALHLDAGLTGVGVAMATAQAMAMVAVRIAWRRTGLALGWRAKGDRKPILRILTGGQGAGFVLAGVLVLSLQADALYLGWFGSLTAVAAFAVVWKVAEAGVQLLWRVPDTLQPFLIHHDARDEHRSLATAYRRVLLWSWLAGPLAGLGFALLGPSLIQLWVGPEHAPADPMAYWAAGGAIVWLTVARPAIVLALATVRLPPVLVIMGAELAAKLALLALLAGPTGFAAPLLAINLVHALGIAWAYQWLGWRLARGGR